MPTETAERETLEIPEVDLRSPDQVKDLHNFLELHKDMFGVKSAMSKVANLHYHLSFVTLREGQLTRAFARLRGEKVPRTRAHDSNRALRATAKKFYEALAAKNIQALDRHCELYGVDPDSFSETSEIVEALVEKYVEANA